MIVRVNAPVYLLCTSLGILGMYVANLPFRGDMYDIDSLSNYRLGLPLQKDNKCNVLSEANMSLRLAYISGVTSIVISALLIVYNLTNKNSETWPVIIVWCTSAIAFVGQILLFIIITTRVSVFFLSCSNPGKISGACPTTRFEAAREPITDKEMCHFNPVTLVLRESESDLFLDCQNSATFQNYNNEFARYDISSYYSAAALCSLNQTQTIGNDLSWCHYWGCHATCNEGSYYWNMKMFILDNALLALILISYIVVMGEFYIEAGLKTQ